MNATRNRHARGQRRLFRDEVLLLTTAMMMLLNALSSLQLVPAVGAEATLQAVGHSHSPPYSSWSVIFDDVLGF